MNRRVLACTIVIFLAAVVGAATKGETPGTEVLKRARAMAADNRFEDAYELLAPVLDFSFPNEGAWEIAAEAGRAAFHLGRYEDARSILRPVVAARPVVLEPALFLGASSYLLGDREQALIIFEAVLAGGVKDLYLAVTLPGETRFLADPAIQDLLQSHAEILAVDVKEGSCLGLRLGESRAEVAATLGANPSDGDLAARAGPHLIWIWRFDAHGMLTEVILHPEHLHRYTPYRVSIRERLFAGATSSDAVEALGPPDRRKATDDGSVILGWTSGQAALDLVFRTWPEGAEDGDRLDLIRLTRPAADSG